MGEPMAGNLVQAGYQVTVHNRSSPAVERLAAAGAQPAGTPAEAAKGADVVILMLPDSPDVELVMNGENGVAGALREGAVLIDMSTISPEVTRRLAGELAGRGVRMLDAPVSGGQQGAIAGTLTIMVGGDADTFASAEPLFDVLGGSVTLIGDSGAGQVAKACNQTIVACTLQNVAEALVLAKRSGVDPARVRQALLGGFAGSKILEIHGQRMLDEAYEPGFKVRLHAKDLDIALRTAAEAGVALPSTAAVRQFLTTLVASGRGELDHSALALVVEQLAAGQEPTA
ncbi:MAG: 2-hydroxy-3-oxopropionate reductase [Streptosporangiales bacterium]|nr:2-hydroxy-3-oxopropionate reductase [Streptosporangiales bacterium]